MDYSKLTTPQLREEWLKLGRTITRYTELLRVALGDTQADRYICKIADLESEGDLIALVLEERGELYEKPDAFE